jgi:pimeloyl-ACP methyl ester carboxylesterase
VVEVSGTPLSALLCPVPEPRAVVLALHGGAARSVYWDCPNRPRLSLLRIGAALGFTVIALDRPGYGSSAGLLDRAGPAARVDVAFAAVERMLDSRPRGAGIFVLGHSSGCELAVRMAADGRGGSLLGVELSGTGRHLHREAERILARSGGDAPWRRNARELHELLWRPERSYPPELRGGAAIAAPAPAYEGLVAAGWGSRHLPELAARVRIPVHFTLGEFERVWRSGPAALADVGALFTASPRVVVEEQEGGGHNLSLGFTAAAYHLKIFSFVEECVVARENEPENRRDDEREEQS